MINKYAVLNPADGQYTKVDSQEEAKKLYVKFVMEFFNFHVHGTPITVIEVNENGDETWKSLNNGTELPDEYLLSIEKSI